MARMFTTLSLGWCTLAVVSAVSLQSQKASLRKQKMTRQDLDLDAEDSDDYEYGDRETKVSQADLSDMSVDQLIENDDGLEGSHTSDDDTGDSVFAKEQAMAADDDSDSEDSPDYYADSFIQTKQSKRSKQPDDGDDFEYGDREMAVSQGDSSDFSIHQFLTPDDGRDGSPVSDDDTGNAEIARNAAEAADDHFNSEDTPDTTDSFAQMRKIGHAK